MSLNPYPKHPGTFIHNLQNRKQTEQGFTLIELLVVIIIIGILAAIAIPIFMNQQKAAQTAALKSDLRNLSITIETFYAQHPNAKFLSQGSANDGDDLDGWSIVAFGSEDAAFRGRTTNGGLVKKETIQPEGFPQIALSDGVGVGVFGKKGYGGLRGYCIAGNAIGSDYDVYSGSGNPLYYDSKYGIVDKSKISDDGACNLYQNRDWGSVPH